MTDSFPGQWHQLLEGCENYLSHYGPSGENILDSDLQIEPLFCLNSFYKQAEELSFQYKQSISNSSADYQNSQNQDLSHLTKLISEENMTWKLLMKSTDPNTLSSHDSPPPQCLSNQTFFSNFTTWYQDKGKSIYENDNTASIEQFMYQRSSDIDALTEMTNFEIFSNILATDPELLRIKSSIQWLETSANIEDLSPKYLMETLGQQIDNSKEIGYLRMDNNKYDETCIKKISETAAHLFRCGRVTQAQKWFESIGIFSWPIVVGGGLPHFDYEIYEKLNPNAPQPQFSSNGNNSDSNTKGGFQFLDFMYNTELENYFASPAHQKDDKNSSGSIGNPNWLIWLRTVDFSSYNEKLIESERGLFSYLASNRDGMLSSCKTVFDRLWVELRCYLNNEVLRRYIVCRKIVREKLLLAEEQGEIDEDFDSKSPLRIFKSLFKNHTSHL